MGRAPARPAISHISSRIFKLTAHLNRQLDQILQLSADASAWKTQKQAAQLETALRKFFP